VACIAAFDGDDLEVRVSSRRGGHAYAAGRRLTRNQMGPLATLRTARRAVSLGDARGSDLASGLEAAIVAVHAVPLAWPDDESFGVLAVVANRFTAWSASDERLVATFRELIEDQLREAAAAQERRQVADAELAIARSLPAMLERLALGAVLLARKMIAALRGPKAGTAA